MLVIGPCYPLLSCSQACQNIKRENRKLWAYACSLENTLVLWYNQTTICRDDQKAIWPSVWKNMTHNVSQFFPIPFEY